MNEISSFERSRNAGGEHGNQHIFFRTKG